MSTVRKHLGLAFLSSLLTVSAAWPAFAERSVRIVEKGVYQAETVARTIVPDATGVRNSVANPRLITSATLIYAKLGVRMGLRFMAFDTQLTNVDLELVIRFPPPGLQNSSSGQRFLQAEYRVTVPINVSQYWEYHFENDWEIVPGTWEFEFWSEGKRLAAQRFCVIDTRDLNKAGSLKVCSPPVVSRGLNFYLRMA
jgi:hypothetical protein